MRRVLRAGAVAVAIAGVIDPAVATERRAPLKIEVRLPPASDPDHSRADAARAELLRSLPSSITTSSASEANAIVALGSSAVNRPASARVFSLPLVPVSPSIAITRLTSPARTVSGQLATIEATVRGLGLSGQRSSVALELGGAPVASLDHAWKSDDEVFEARLTIAAPPPGVHRVRVRATSQTLGQAAVADQLVVVRDAPVRVLAYEARPSWPLSFVRRSLEVDSVFDVSSTTRVSRVVRSTAGDAPESFAGRNLDGFDVVLVGGLEGLTPADLDALDRFASVRGGTLVLLPDRQLPAVLRQRFQLPAFDEVLLERPARIEGGGHALRASELLLSADAAIGIGRVRHGSDDRTVIARLERDAGRILLSGALDAWRYRAEGKRDFDLFWRGLIADAALAAPPAIELSVTPALTRPGEPVEVTARLRRTTFDDGDGRMRLPPVTAALEPAEGRREIVRMWPGPAAGLFRGVVTPATPGHHLVTISAGGNTVSDPLVVAADVEQPSRAPGGAAAHAAEMTGGVVVTDVRDLVNRLTALPAPATDHVYRPMRSAWWIAPFAALLCAEWMLRRRAGAR